MSSKPRGSKKPKRSRKRRAVAKDSYLKIEGDPLAAVDRFLALPSRRAVKPRHKPAK